MKKELSVGLIRKSINESKKTNRSTCSVLKDRGFEDAETALMKYAHSKGITIIETSDLVIMQNILSLISSHLAWMYKIIPIRHISEEEVEMLICHPIDFDLDALNEIKGKTGMDVTLVCTTENELERLLIKYYGPPPWENLELNHNGRY